MSTVLAPEAVDLDFTYGDEFAHLYDGQGSSHAICGARRTYKHRGHGSFPRFEPAPKSCPTCGAPVCPVCAHIHDSELL